MKRALVLSGGGAKGSYQIGAWKALKKLKIKIDIVTGTSIGAANGALVVQKDYYKALRLWNHIKTTDLLTYDKNKAILSKENKKAIKEMIKNAGMPNIKGEMFLRRYLNENKIRKSKIDFGIVTVNINTKTPKMITKEQMPEGKLIDYVVASCSCFPAISKKEIDGSFYIDGGYYDNLPINLAIEMGADEIIAIDLSAIGKKRKTSDKDIKIDIIKNKNVSQLFSLDFSKEKMKYQMALGYNDTMKYFKKLDGQVFTFKKNSLSKNYEKLGYYYEDVLREIFLNCSKHRILKEIFKITKYNRIMMDLNANKPIDKTILDSLEYLGEIFNLPKDKIYNEKTYNKLLLKKVKELNYIKIGKNLKGKMLVGYIYNKYLECDNKDNIYKELFNIALIFPKDFLASLYLISITKKYPIQIKIEEFHDEFMKMFKGV